VYPLLTLRVWRELLDYGIRPGSGDEMIRYGGLKAFVDGFLMFDPYVNNPNYAGSLTFRVVDEQTMENDIVSADSAGFDSAVHVIGDKAHNLLLNWYEAAIARNRPRDRRFRLIHAWYPSPKDIQRAGRMKAIAEITPYHLLRDVLGIERSLGPERAKTAHAWRTMIQNGIRLNLVSDFPGSFDKSSLSPVHPLENMFYAIARQHVSGIPPGGWHAGEAMTIQEAIQAYTINPAFASHEEHLKGNITEGKLADLVVLSRDVLSIEPRELLSTEVLYTVFDGRIVYRK
jgi:predicted amidohydrolase YtcJ